MTYALILLAVVMTAGAALVWFTAWTARRVEAALPPPGKFVEIGGARLQYVERGEGPALLLIHGLGAGVRTFTHSLVERLADDYRVVVMERPGSGNSTRAPGASARVWAQADTVSAFIDALGLDRPVLVGHSLGGAVSLAVALKHPEQVRGLALVAPVANEQEEVPDIFRLLLVRSRALRQLVAWTLATPSAVLRRERVLATLFGPDPVPRDYATAGGGLLGLRPKNYRTSSEDLVALEGELAAMVGRYGELRGPVGILYGTSDRVLDHQHHGVTVASKIPGADLELLEGGHMLPLTAPDRVAAFVRRIAARAFGARREEDEAAETREAEVTSRG